MGWLSRKVGEWSVSKQKSELEKWLGMARAMNSDELGLLVAVATHLRHNIEEKYEVNLLDPVLAYAAKPEFPITLNQLIKQFQSQGQPTDAAGTMVWLFTLRSGSSLELRQGGRDLWRELRRGFPYVEEAAQNVFELSGLRINTSGSEQIPIGLEPERT